MGNLKITHLECHKALKKALSRNFNFRWLDVIFRTVSITWCIAAQFKKDEERKWHPRVVTFFPASQRICVQEYIGASELWLDVATLVAMGAEATPIIKK